MAEGEVLAFATPGSEGTAEQSLRGGEEGSGRAFYPPGGASFSAQERWENQVSGECNYFLNEQRRG